MKKKIIFKNGGENVQIETFFGRKLTGYQEIDKTIYEVVFVDVNPSPKIFYS